MAYKDNFPKMFSYRPELYDEFAEAEDKRNKIISFILKKTSFKNKVLLDVGAGTCKFPILLSKYCKKIHALDPSKAMLKVAENKIKKSGIKNIEIINGHAGKLPFPSKSVDIVFSSWAFLQDTVTNKKRAINEILRVLKDNGKIFIVECDHSGEFLEIWRKTLWPTIMGDVLNSHLLIQDLHKFKKYIVKTSIDFPTVNKAAEIMGFILGNKAKKYILKNKISKLGIDVAIFYATK